MSKIFIRQTADKSLLAARCRTTCPAVARLAAVVMIVCCGSVLRSTAEESASPMVCPTVDPPTVLVACDIDAQDHLILVSYHSIFIGFSGEAYNERLTQRVSLEGVQIRTADGKTLTVEAVRKIIAGKDTPILATSYETQLPKFFAAMFANGTLHFAFPKRAPAWRQIESPSSIVK